MRYSFLHLPGVGGVTFLFCNLRQQKHKREKKKKKRAELNNHGTWPCNLVPQKLVSKQQKITTYQRGCSADPLSGSRENNDLPIKSTHPGTCGLIYRCVFNGLYCSPWPCAVTFRRNGSMDSFKTLKTHTSVKYSHHLRRSPSISKNVCPKCLALHIKTFSKALVAQSVKNLCSAGDTGLIPGLGRSPGEANGNPVQYPCQENPTDRGSWKAAVHGVVELDMTKRLSHTEVVTDRQTADFKPSSGRFSPCC